MLCCEAGVQLRCDASRCFAALFFARCFAALFFARCFAAKQGAKNKAAKQAASGFFLAISAQQGFLKNKAASQLRSFAASQRSKGSAKK
jgi:hypothetical protein